MGSQIVTSAALKLLQQTWCPIRSVVFQAITEDGVWRMIAERLHQALSDGVQMCLDRILIVVIKYESLSADCGALHSHSGPAGDEEHSAGTAGKLRGDR